MSHHKEIEFENDICRHLAEHGWLYEQDDAARYDRQRALFADDVLAWVQQTQPQAWEILSRNHGAAASGMLLDRIRKQLDDAMEQSTRYANQIAKVENDTSLENVRKSGKTQIHTPTAEERAAFKKALVPVHKKMESRIGKETIDAVYKATGFNPNKL